MPQGWWRKGTAQLHDAEYHAAKATFQQGLKHCPGDDNLLKGLDKATKGVEQLDKIQGAVDDFDPDGPSTRDRRADDTSPDNLDHATALPVPAKVQDPVDVFPGDAATEIDRIKSAPNHYAVLHVSTDADNVTLKKNYYTLARMLHPDKCQLDGAEDAMTAVSQAYDTLTNVVKKTLYDQFLSQTGADNEHPNQTYQEWESRQQPVQLPKWLSFLLEIKGCGWILAILVFALLLPFVIVLLVVYVIITILTLPIRLIYSFCFPEKYAQMTEQRERERVKMEEEAQDRIFAHV